MFTKYAKITIRYLITIVPVFCCVLISQGNPVMANGQKVFVEPQSGAPGTEVQITGEMFYPTLVPGTISTDTSISSVQIFFPDKETPVKVATINTYGYLNSEFTIGDYPAGKYDIWVHEEIAGRSTWSSVTFTIKPGIRPGKTSGYEGENITLYGNGFAAGSDIDIYCNDLKMCSEISDINGSFLIPQITIPERSENICLLKAVDRLGNEASASFTTRNQRVIVSPGLSYVGENVKIDGSGFTAGENIAFSLYNAESIYADISSVPDSIIVNEKGEFSAYFQIPFCPADTYVIEASDGTIKAAAIMEVKPKSTLDHIIGFIGSVVSYNGNGFHPGRFVIVSYDGIPLTEVNVDNDGIVLTSFSIPPGPAGEHIISITDGENTESYVFSVFSRAQIEINRNSGYVGSEIILIGKGFIPGRAALVRYDDIPVSEASINTEASFTTTFLVPVCLSGEHIITITDGINSVQSVLDIESLAPPSPKLIAPMHDNIPGPEVHLVWEDVTDLSGVSYVIQIASDPVFTTDTMIVETSGLSLPEYHFTPESKAAYYKKGMSFYWRVKAIDFASNTGDWSEIGDFSIADNDSPFASYGLFAEMSAIGGMLIFWFVRKKKQKSEAEPI
jgi:hypothetical protein